MWPQTGTTAILFMTATMQPAAYACNNVWHMRGGERSWEGTTVVTKLARPTNDCCLAATLCAFLKLSRYIVVIVVVVAASGLLIV